MRRRRRRRRRRGTECVPRSLGGKRDDACKAPTGEGGGRGEGAYRKEKPTTSRGERVERGGGGREHPEGPSSFLSLSPSRMMVRWPVRERGRKEGDSTKIVKTIWEVLFTSIVFFFFLSWLLNARIKELSPPVSLPPLRYIPLQVDRPVRKCCYRPSSLLSFYGTHTHTHTLVSSPSPAASDTSYVSFRSLEGAIIGGDPN